MRKLDTIVIHCAATPNFQHYTVRDIDEWHKRRGFIRKNPKGQPELKSIGYHFVIYIDGSVHKGRDISEIGAHAAGHNAGSVGICLIGTDDFTAAQWDALKDLVTKLRDQYGALAVIGHRDLLGVKKTCPGFNAHEWFVTNFIKGANYV